MKKQTKSSTPIINRTDRSAKIIESYKTGSTVQELAEEYKVTEKVIRIIIIIDFEPRSFIKPAKGGAKIPDRYKA